jgi:AhpD family alkylhydroperoxidase
MDARLKLFDNLFAGELPKRAVAPGQVVKGSLLPAATQELVALSASQDNGCDFCMDMHTKDAAAAGESSVPLNLFPAWRQATVFTEADRRCDQRRPAERHHPAARRRLSVWPTRMTSHTRTPAGGEMFRGHVVVDVERHPLTFGDWLSA